MRVLSSLLLCMAFGFTSPLMANADSRMMSYISHNTTSIDISVCGNIDLSSTDPLVTPWLAPPCVRYAYENLEKDLPALLRIQASEHKWITIVTMTGKIKHFVLNCLYSLVAYGKQPHYIVAAFERESLEACKKLRLPCFDAAHMTPHKIENGVHNFISGQAHAMWWAKQRIALSILRCLLLTFAQMNI